MFKILTEFTGEIPLGVYRTDKTEAAMSPTSKTSVTVDVQAENGDTKKGNVFVNASLLMLML